jgi:hypothetical protein
MSKHEIAMRNRHHFGGSVRAAAFMGLAQLCAGQAFGAEKAAALPGVSFSHNDWQLACDNTMTCRAAGYNSEGDSPVSILLTRKAGPHEPVLAEVKLGMDDQDNRPSGKLRMRINGRDLGRLIVDAKSAKLTAKQVDTLVVSLRASSTIEIVLGDDVWPISDSGASAVLLKMDEFQARIGTTGALVHPGKRSEEGVAKPLPVPVVRTPPLPPAQPQDRALEKHPPASLIKALRATFRTPDDCQDLFAKGARHEGFTVTRLSANKLLVSTRCWLAAYNEGMGCWVVDDKPPFHAELVTESASDSENGRISSEQKDRGPGDCWSGEEWAWDGQQFVHTRSFSTGKCKSIEPGGAWDLPTLVTEVR